MATIIKRTTQFAMLNLNHFEYEGEYYTRISETVARNDNTGITLAFNEKTLVSELTLSK